MIILRVVANESNSDYTSHGEDIHFLVQGKTIQSCTKRAIAYLNKLYYYFEYEIDETDYMNFLYTEFSRWHKSPDNWTNLYSFTFIKPNQAGIMHIEEDMYNQILEDYEDYYVNNGETAENTAPKMTKQMNKEKEIAPCPFCGGTKIKYSSKTMGSNRYKKQYHIAMYCDNCHCYGPRTIITLNDGERRDAINDKKYVQMAINRWNGR